MMIRQIVLLIWIVCMAVMCTAQSLPFGGISASVAEEEVLYILRDYDPYGLEIDDSEVDMQRWDVSTLRAPYARPYSIRPGASMYSSTQSFDYDYLMENDRGLRSFYREDMEAVVLVAEELAPFTGSSEKFLFIYEDPIPMLMRNFEPWVRKSSFTNARAMVGTELLPPHIQAKIGGQEKVALVLQIEMDREVRSGGTLRFLMEEDWVIKESVQIKSEFSLELDNAKALRIPWKGTVDNFVLFYVEDQLFPKLRVKLDDHDNVDWAEYNPRVNLKRYELKEGLPTTNHFIVYPNPTYDFVKFQFEGFPPETYTIRITNILGKLVDQFDIDLDHDDAWTFSLVGYRKGTYLYSVTDSFGRTITTRRLIVLNP